MKNDHTFLAISTVFLLGVLASLAIAFVLFFWQTALMR